jgi:hypothetical protein
MLNRITEAHVFPLVAEKDDEGAIQPITNKYL